MKMKKKKILINKTMIMKNNQVIMEKTIVLYPNIEKKEKSRTMN